MESARSESPRCDPEVTSKTLETFIHFIMSLGKVARSNRPAWFSHRDVTLGHIKTLMFLLHEGTTTVGGVAEGLGVSEPTASQLVDRLVRADHAERHEDPEDRRRTLIVLTNKGRKLVEARAHIHAERMGAIMRRVSEDDREALCRGLRAVMEAAENMDDVDTKTGTHDARVQEKL